MSIIEFLKDKLLFLAINLVLFIVVAITMAITNVDLVIIFMVFCIWFIPLILYIVLDMMRHKKYYDEIYRIIEELDKKYLLPEVLNEPNFIQGKILNKVLKEIARDMHENVKYYKDIQHEYREYIETWVHEIKTPIASAKLLVENNSNDITKKIDIQLDRIDGFVEQALYYSKSDNVSKDYIIKEFTLSNVINAVIKRNYRDFINKRIKLDLKDIDHKVYTDAKWVEFIINQIIVNSIKYSKENDARISIYSQQKENSIILTIEDNGVGISGKDINRVFEKGFTGENGRRFGKSTGIGLYLCKNLCRKLGLEIHLKSEIGIGTSVTIIFPCSRYDKLL
ncbi:sensor histidine kinase [Natronincola ferrireducens]|uniref:histidine kinase n=1 Tax=Natronincola ferrireducens TaxID=393762 RepID=A0A1G9DY10_9FIRM|nr:sensor histidine kinase [Natronincola ferrireducens]SDK68700.1 Signal transduction histidine kinase [Natronincola ferrireducens]